MGAKVVDDLGNKQSSGHSGELHCELTVRA